MAPRSSAPQPTKTVWFRIRVISANIVRMYFARRGTWFLNLLKIIFLIKFFFILKIIFIFFIILIFSFIYKKIISLCHFFIVLNFKNLRQCCRASQQQEKSTVRWSSSNSSPICRNTEVPDCKFCIRWASQFRDEEGRCADRSASRFRREAPKSVATLHEQLDAGGWKFNNYCFKNIVV